MAMREMDELLRKIQTQDADTPGSRSRPLQKSKCHCPEHVLPCDSPAVTQQIFDQKYSNRAEKVRRWQSKMVANVGRSLIKCSSVRKPVTGYGMFQRAHPEVSEQVNVVRAAGNISHNMHPAMTSAEWSARWGNLSDEERQEFHDKAAEVFAAAGKSELSYLCVS